MSSPDVDGKETLQWSTLIRFVGALLAILLILLLLVILWFWPFISQGRFMRNGEKWAKRVVTGDELQAWALKVLADPENKALRTNYPAQLRDLCWGDHPQVMVIANTNYPPPSVLLVWGHVDWMAGFEIGSTNFVGRGHEWQPGVYYIFQH
jgi:hypothetical protein